MTSASSPRYSFAEAGKFTVSLALSQSTVLLSPLIIKSSGIAEYGRIEVALALASITSILLSLGLHQLVGVRYIKSRNALRPLVETTLLYLFCLMAATVFFALGAKGVISPLLGDASVLDLVTIFVFAALVYFKHLTLSIAAMSYKANLYLALEFFSALSYASIVIVGLVSGKVDLTTILYANVASVVPNILAVAMFTWRKRAEIADEISHQLGGAWAASAGQTLRASMPLMMIGLLAAAGGSVDRLLLAHYGISPADIGAYSLAFRLVSLAPLAIQNLIGNIHSREIYLSLSMEVAKQSSGLRHEIRKNARLAVQAFFVMMAMFGVGYFVLGIVLPFVYGLNADSFPWYFVLVMAFSLSVASSFLTSICIYTERTGALLVANILGVAGFAIVNFTMIPIWGVWASAVAFLLLHVLRLIYLAITCLKIYREPIWN
jgi:O-antigen/teichoic acid export membrane protein